MAFQVPGIRATIAASGLVSVSQIYIDIMRRRYEERNPAWLRVDRNMVVPFAVLPRDFDEAAKGAATTAQRTVHQANIVYVGAGGPIMRRSFSLVCRALSRLRVQIPNW